MSLTSSRIFSLCLLPFLLVAANVQQADAANRPFTVAMQSAAQSRRVPVSLIEAIAYVNTRWEWISTPAADGGVGPMHILPSQMAEAIALSGHSSAQIVGELQSNVDAGAVLLARYHTKGTDLSSWGPAVVSTQGSFVAAQIFDAMRKGATRTTSTGEIISLPPQVLPSSGSGTLAPAAPYSYDYPPATWIPANAANYSVANRPHDYTVDMIVIHDIEGSVGSAIQIFQDPNRQASAHYIVSYGGYVTQMVFEHDIAWHAGNWDYNTRAIGIEHEGFAWTPGLYTTAEYNASALLAASICSRWGVPMDRQHVIGHNEVPDPFHPGLFGGSDHHTDPGPYWNWTYYMARAQADAAALPSPPRMMPDPVAVNDLTSVKVTWQPARTCRAANAPITGYTVVGQPGNLTMNVPATTTTATFNGLQQGVTYTFTVTAHNSYGNDSLTSNPSTPGRCASVGLISSPISPQRSGTAIQLAASSTGCPNPRYQFWMLAPGSSAWKIVQAYGNTNSNIFNWNPRDLPAGTYSFSVWADDAASPGNFGDVLGRWDASNNSQYLLTPATCTAMSASSLPLSQAPSGTAVTIAGIATGCPSPFYQFWMLAPGSSTWKNVQPYSNNATYSWNTTGMPAGTYSFSVWAHDLTSGGTYGDSLGRWDNSANSRYTLTTAPCTSVGITSSPSDTTAVGTPVTFTGNAAACPFALYQFWMLAPGSSTWQVVQPYMSPNGAIFHWSTTGKTRGVYHFSVWAKDSGSAGVYGDSVGRWDASSNPTYTLT